jgi:tetratricopeptide (TPR) repeat protein
VRRGLAAILTLVLLAVWTPAVAEPRRAREHFDEAESLYAQGDFEAALSEYLAAFDEQPLPELLFNVGQCQRNLDRYGDAIFSFRRYLALRPDAPNREAVLKLVAELERKREREEIRPPPVSAPPEPQRVALVPTPARAEARPASGRPFYKKWWFITGVLVAGAAVTGAVILSSDGGGDPGGGGTGPLVPTTDLGNVELPR